ncbi:MAG: hypothetical protein ABI560_15840 [Myxococcales bacterium]
MAAAVVAASTAGCGSSASVNYDSGVGGPVTGDLDNHCVGHEPVVVSMASCHPATSDGGSTGPDAGAQTDAGTTPEPEAPILFNAEGDDDDCKYHVKFMITAAKVDQNATIRLTVTHLADGKPAVGATVNDGMSIESYLKDNDGHFIPNNNTAYTETPGTGVYTISPVKFDAAGRWVVRFHLYERCSDANEDSPHGHVAFYLDVAG